MWHPQSEKLIIVGDINLDIARKDDQTYYNLQRLLKWLDLIDETGLAWLETKYTYKSYGKHDGEHHYSTLDHVYQRGFLNCECTINVLDSAPTDHYPVVATFSKALNIRKPLETRTERNFKGIEKYHYQDTLIMNGMFDVLDQPNDPDIVNSGITNCMIKYVKY